MSPVLTPTGSHTAGCPHAVDWSATIPARREAGHQLDHVLIGREPDDWKPMNTVGQGVREIRIRDEAGAFRVLYAAKFADAIYVLHCFQKRTGKIGAAEVELAAKRYRELSKEPGQ